ncbi:MAG: transglycosylase domain-containing protein, partial [Clostridia bacterium]|nr:transglycosylase domain-containing protein [Clostridia bacterium]
MKAKTQRSKKKHSRLRLIFSIFLLLLFISVLSFTVYIGTAFQTEFPSRWYDPEFLPTSPSFYVYRFEDRVGRLGERVEVTGEIYAQKQTQYHQYDNIPTSMIDAFVAIEDKRFFEHEGVDWYRTIAAGANYLLGFSDSFGASTITQQLVKNLTGNDDVTVKRKIQEILYALDLERNLDKKKIMELYLNVIHFSDNCDGIGMAAEHYFSKSPMELTVAECATIAAITNSPSYYNPIRNPENNLKRRDLILSQMYEQGFITQTEYTEAKSTPLALDVDESVGREGINSWYTDMVIEDVVQDLMNKYSMSRAAATHLFYTGGLQIDIAMDEEIQALVEDYYKTALELPKNGSGESAQSAIILIDAKTGDILGVAGAAGEKKGNLLQSFATKTLRSPGSTIKPLSVYAPAIEEGIIDWATVYDDVPIEFHTNSSLTWPKNATGVYRGLTNISYAVAHSTNTVSIKVLERLGLERSFLYAKERFHLSNMIHQSGKTDCDVAALGLGQLNYGVTLREITNAYTAFADGGVYHACRSYYRVLDKEGTILLSRADSSERILSRETAAIMTKLLEGVITHGTSSTITLQRVCECAGKTGTTNKDHDRWFIGYTPDVVCGVWCGYEYPEPIEGRNVC